MKIYFTTSLQSGTKYSKEVKKILDHICQNNEVYLRPKLRDGIDIQREKLDIEKIYGVEFAKPGTSIQEIFQQTQQRIMKSDIVIAEMSYGSTGLGYDVAQAIVQRKPVLVLTSVKDQTSGNNAILGETSKSIWNRTYTSDTVESIISEFINESKKLLDSKFILIIPPEIERYLSWASNKKGIRKAEIVRSAIEKAMDLDNDWKKYTGDLVA